MFAKLSRGLPQRRSRDRAMRDPAAPIRVAFVLPNLDVGGAQRANLLIGRYLSRREVEPVFVSLHCRNPERKSLRPLFEAAGLDVYELGLRRRADRSVFACVSGALRLRRLCRDMRIDLVDSAVIESDLVARLSTIRTRAAHVTHLVNTTYDAAVARRLPPRSRIRLGALRKVDALTARRTDAFVAITSGVGESAIENLGIDSDKVVVIPRGVDLAHFAFAPRRPPNPELRIVSLGRLAPQKGHETTLSAMACLQEWEISARLTIAGEGSLLDDLRRHADALGVAERVTFAGAVDTDVVVELLANADVFCFPSRWEGQGNALLEAMASGCPVVASDIPPLREVLGDTGILFTPGNHLALADSLRRVAQMTEDERAALGRKGRERVEHTFDAHGKVRELERFYRALLRPDAELGCRGTEPTTVPIHPADGIPAARPRKMVVKQLSRRGNGGTE
jgi:glycosyltransferase involved in cell wall biosynthesis